MGLGAQRHRVRLENPGVPIPDGKGQFTEPWTALSPRDVSASIAPATARDLERVVAGTVQSSATHLIRIRFHPQVTMRTRITKGPRLVDGTLAPGSREFSVTGTQNVDELNREMVIVAVEVVP